MESVNTFAPESRNHNNNYMKAKIFELLKSIEDEFDVKVLYACESGSRAWGIDSVDSKYDVRFIYVRPENEYLKLNSGRDVIEKLVPGQGIGEDIDLAGWDLKKALALFGKNNPSFLEWINSPVIYMRDPVFFKRLSELEDGCFSPRACFLHYYDMGTGNDSRYLEKDGIYLKEFLNYFRSLLCCEWIMRHKSLPPVSFRGLLERIRDDEIRKVDRETYDMAVEKEDNVFYSVIHLLDLKKRGYEYDKAPVDESVVRYVERLRQEVDAYQETHWEEVAAPQERLDDLFIDTVRRVTEGHFNAKKQAIPVSETVANEREFLFEYDSIGDGWGHVRMGTGDSLVELRVSAMGRNPLRDMLFGLIEIRDYHRDEHRFWWDTSSGDVLLCMKPSSEGVSLTMSKLNYDTDKDDEYSWSLSLDELIHATLKAAGRTLRERGIVGFSKDWVKMNGDECDVFPFADFFALSGVKTRIEDGDQVVSTFDDELRILQGLQEEKQ